MTVTAPKSELEKLLAVWKVLETLAVSLDRMGIFWHFHSEEQAKAALLEYMNPALVQRIAHARRLTIEVMQEHDPAIYDRLEALSEQDNGIGYWDGPSWMQEKTT